MKGRGNHDGQSYSKTTCRLDAEEKAVWSATQPMSVPRDWYPTSSPARFAGAAADDSSADDDPDSPAAFAGGVVYGASRSARPQRGTRRRFQKLANSRARELLKKRTEKAMALFLAGDDAGVNEVHALVARVMLNKVMH